MSNIPEGFTANSVVEVLQDYFAMKHKSKKGGDDDFSIKYKHLSEKEKAFIDKEYGSIIASIKEGTFDWNTADIQINHESFASEV